MGQPEQLDPVEAPRVNPTPNDTYQRPTISTRVDRALRDRLEANAARAGVKLAHYLVPWLEVAAAEEVVPQVLGKRSAPTTPALATPGDPHAWISDLVTSGTAADLEQLRELARAVADGIDVLDRRLRPGRAIEIRALVLTLVTERAREAGALLSLAHVPGATAREVRGVICDMERGKEIAAVIKHYDQTPEEPHRPDVVTYRLPLALVGRRAAGEARGDEAPPAPVSGVGRSPDLLAGLPLLREGWTREAAPLDGEPPTPRQMLAALVRVGETGELEAHPRSVPELGKRWPHVPVAELLRVSLLLIEVDAIQMSAGRCKVTRAGLACAALAGAVRQLPIPADLLPEPVQAARPSLIEAVEVLRERTIDRSEAQDLGGGDGLAGEPLDVSGSVSRKRRRKKEKRPAR